MSRDGNLRIMFRNRLPEFFWASVESSTEPGIPDSYYCCKNVSGWIEFKKTDANKVSSLSYVQVSWHAAHARKGGRSFFFVRSGRSLFAFKGTQGEAIFVRGLKASDPLWVGSQPWNWGQIRNVLISP